MSRAILRLVGLADAPHEVAVAVLNGLFQACNLRQPLDRYVLLVTPEAARLVRKIELADEWLGMDLRWLAAKLARRRAQRDHLQIVAIGEDAPVFRSIALAPVRRAFAVACEVANNSGVAPVIEKG